MAVLACKGRRCQLRVVRKNLGALLKSLGRSQEAEPILSSSLVTNEKLFASNHPSLAAALTQLADSLLAQSECARVEPLFVRALALSNSAVREVSVLFATDGVDTIDVTSARTGIFALNHDVYSESPLLIADMGRTIAEGKRPPDQRTIASTGTSLHFAKAISHATLKLFPRSGHFVFFGTYTVVGRIFLRAGCGDPNGTERNGVHAETIRLALDFFTGNLH